ncbi:hypothetical protein PAESOLCIP111_05504 [Paenibacillus solanacearum]|uniref:Extracellular solute-binding protein n=1 Tax=Paenibacillus solanacearum TaxID=2048548 RepID=A0A916K9R5_9BACL|nr:extracellular solute-binding protein [Paenibacillus solanacearum]CAG7648003.1 hypothetical protein PAESOLCIP111_05504 [Paenibacillus solanacearum]
METRIKRLSPYAMASLVAMTALTGCSSAVPDKPADKTAPPEQTAQTAPAAPSKGTKEPVVSAEPVTLKFYAHVAEMDEGTFKTYIYDFVKKKYPNITLEFSFGPAGNLAKLIAAGTIPDIIYSGSDNYMSMKDLGIPYDMGDLLKANNFDLSVFTDLSMETLKGLGAGKVTAVPFGRNASALYYNKDLFDKFGVPYPTNDMTYDDVISLARKMTRTENGVQYIGWEPGFPDANASPFIQPFVDTKTNKALVDTPFYKKIFDMMKTGYEIPGFIGPNNTFRYAPKSFVDDHVIGMYVDWYNKMLLQFLTSDANGNAANWDLVTVPNFTENAKMGRHESVQFMLVTKQTKYKDQAIQVIKAATSTEAQLLQARTGRISVLKDPEMLKQFAKDVKALQGKHLENLFQYKAAPSAQATIYDDDIRTIVRNVSKEIAVNHKDVNTALREAQEMADKKVAEINAAKK